EAARRPPSTHTATTRLNSGTALDTAYGFLKTPEPMIVPMTMAVVIQGPSTRGKRAGASTEVFAESMANSVRKLLCGGRVGQAWRRRTTEQPEVRSQKSEVRSQRSANARLTSDL